MLIPLSDPIKKCPPQSRTIGTVTVVIEAAGHAKPAGDAISRHLREATLAISRADTDSAVRATGRPR